MTDTDRAAIQSAIRQNTAGMTAEAYQDALTSTVQHYAKNVLGLDAAAAEEAVADIIIDLYEDENG